MHDVMHITMWMYSHHLDKVLCIVIAVRLCLIGLTFFFKEKNYALLRMLIISTYIYQRNIANVMEHRSGNNLQVTI